MTIYRAREGDTVASVAREHGILPTILCEQNGLAPDAPLAVGQALLISRPTETARVCEGDTLKALAARLRLPCARLLRHNPTLASEGGLYPGRSVLLKASEPCHGAITVLGYAHAECPREALTPVLPYLTFLAVLSATLDADGLTLPDDAAVVATAREGGVMPLLVVSAAGEDGREGERQRTDALLSDPEAADTLLARISPHLRERGYGGILLDLPLVGPKSRDAYRTLVMTLRRRLAPRTAVFCTLTPEGEEGQDASLLRAAGGVVLSAYGFGGRYGPPSPEAPLDCVEGVLRALGTAGRPQKLLLGISTRALDYPVANGSTEVYPAADIPRRAHEAHAAISVDEVGRVPYLAYRREGEERIAFFEDVGSVLEKLLLCERLGVGGVALFPCEGAAQSVLSLLAEAFAIVRAYGE